MTASGAVLLDQLAPQQPGQTERQLAGLLGRDRPVVPEATPRQAVAATTAAAALPLPALSR
ncbi:hypothetical protein ACFQU7_15055 [Pseudoroseomonas wenyumeiae]